ncbi:MAG TPA: glycoside hydrolase family 2 TIM barrel-domain containing protein [Mucilaginibacter sp.]|jgi:beta-galactosidase
MKKRLFGSLLLVVFSTITYAKSPVLSRYHLLMDRDWKFFLDDDKNASEVSFNDNTWRKLDLPHDWSIEGEFKKDEPTGGGGGYLPTGIGWYRKQFTLPLSVRGKQVSIQFDGVYMNSEVWINGHYLGKRPNGYISFVYDLTPYLASGKNTIAVRVDNSKQPNSRWYSGSGIYRHVWLNITNPLHIAQWGTYITTPAVSTTSATVSIKTKIENNGQNIGNATLLSTIVDENGNEVASAKTPISLNAKASKEFEQSIQVTSPALWSVETPHLYTLHSTILSGKKVVDEFQSNFGIRKLEYSSVKGFLLNDKHVKMNGVCLHHDGGCVGAAVPIKIWEERLNLLKKMGCNAIRTSHNPTAPEFLDLCDKMGFLVMDEAFDAWESGKVKNDYHLYFDEWSQIDVTDQIHRDRNHPSVVLWSAGNEVPDQTKDKGIQLIKDLLATFHKEDPTRPVTTANDDIAADNGSTKLEFMEAEDIVGYNYVDRWHERRELFYSIDHADYPNWKMIGTEDDAVRNAPEYSLGKNANTVTPNYLGGMIRAEQLWKYVAVHDYVIGDFMWTGIDYLGEARWPGKGSSSGEIDITGLPKDGYYFYQSQWTSNPVLHLLPHWNWQGREGQIIPVLAYTNCDTVELFVNGKSYGIKMQEFPRQGNSGAWNKYAKPYVNISTADLHLSWDVAYQPGTLKAVGRKNGKQIIVEEIHTAGKPVALQLTTDSSRINADGEDVALIHVTVVDANGNVVPDAVNNIQFAVTGTGKLIGVDNGNQLDDSSFKLNSRKAYNGRAYAVIQTDGKPGVIKLTVQSDGLKPASVTINSQPALSAAMTFENLR